MRRHHECPITRAVLERGPKQNWTRAFIEGRISAAMPTNDSTAVALFELIVEGDVVAKLRQFVSKIL